MSRFAVGGGNKHADFSLLVEMMADPEKYRERINGLKEQEAALDQKIATCGEVDQIHNLRLQTAEANAAAAEGLRKTEEQCAKMRQEAAEGLRKTEEQCAAKLAEHHRHLADLEAAAKARIAGDIATNQAACKARQEQAEAVLQEAKQQAANTEQECATRKKMIDAYLAESIAFMGSQAEMVSTMVREYHLELESQRQRLALL